MIVLHEQFLVTSMNEATFFAQINKMENATNQTRAALILLFKQLQPSAPSVNTTTGPQSPIMPSNKGNVSINGDNTQKQPAQKDN